MIRNLKALGLALLAICALGAVASSAASAAVEHDFHADGEKAVTTATGANHEFLVGSNPVKCKKVQAEGTQVGKGSGTTWAADEITVTPHYEECEFGGKPATVDFMHCAYKFDSDTTTGNTTGGEHAQVEVECQGEDTITVITSVGTITVGPQVIKDAISYKNDPSNKNAIEVIATAHEITVSCMRTLESQPVNGCLLVPTGKVGKYTGTTTSTCYKDEGTALVGTETTTPTGKTKESVAETECKVSNL